MFPEDTPFKIWSTTKAVVMSNLLVYFSIIGKAQLEKA